MRTVFITKAQAIALLTLMTPPDLVKEGIRHVVNHPWLGPEGTKVGAIRRGCVLRYYVSGYTQDGSDVRKALADITSTCKVGEVGPALTRSYQRNPPNW